MNSIFKCILSCVIGFVSLLAVYVFSSIRYFKKGQENERQQQVEESVKETMRVKKEIQSTNSLPIDSIRERMRKYTRD
jgi:large-conductance mechanosensitive channel